MPITMPTATQGTAVGYNPANVTGAQINPGSLQQINPELVSNQLSGILNSGSPLMQQAAVAGNSAAAARGLLNSSMGIQAAQNAMIQNASPIAQANANAINQAAAQNAQQNFNMLNTNVANQQQAAMANAAAANQASQFGAQQSNAMNQWNAGQQNEMMKQTLDINSRESLANIEANYKTLLQTNSSAGGMYEQYLKNISDISMNKDIDAYAKQTAINNQIAYLRAGMQMLSNMSGIQNMVTF